MTTLSIPQSIRINRIAPSKQKFMPYALWTIQGLLALTFLFTGVTKLVMSGEDLTKDIDLPVAFLRFIGVCEVLGAIGLIGPGILGFRRGLTPLAASGLVIIMVGATVVTIAA